MAEEFSLKDALAGMTEAQKGGVFAEQDAVMKCVEAEYIISAKKGTKGWRYVGEFLEGENQGETVEGTAWYSTRTKNSIPFMLGQMYALGITDGMISELGNEDLAAAMVGAIFKGRVSIDVQNNGRKRNQLVAQEALGGDDAEAGELGGGVDELGFDEFTSASADVSAVDEDPAITAANAAPPLDATGDDVPVALPEEDPLEALWEPSK